MPVASTDDAIGFGFSAQQADLIGATPVKISGAAATLQTGAAIITSEVAELSPAAVTTNSFVFPTTAKIAHPYHLINTSATVAAFVFVPSGHTIVGGTGVAATANGSVVIGAYTASTNTAILWQYKYKNWAYK